ncbi:MAG: hypothetical protein ACREDM_15895 [Methylocella sp.]
MKTKYAISTFAALAFVAAGPLFVAAASVQDAMKPEGTSRDHMKSEGMKADTMKSGHMESDAMKSGHTGDAMGTQK